MLIELDLCLSDIDKNLIKTAKNGKKYLCVYVSDRKEPDQFGNTHAVYNIDRNTNEKKYIGKGKEKVFGVTQQGEVANTATTAPAPTPEKGLPF